jgi:hypothetical protein
MDPTVERDAHPIVGRAVRVSPLPDRRSDGSGTAHDLEIGLDPPGPLPEVDVFIQLPVILLATASRLAASV